MPAPSTVPDASASESAPVFVLLKQDEHADLVARREAVTRLTAELKHANARILAAERVAHDADEIARSLRIGEFRCEGLVSVGKIDGCENVWIRVRSTGSGIEAIRSHIARLDERARTAEAALERSIVRSRDLEKRAERSDWTAGELRRAEFEWQDTIPVNEPGGERVLVCVRGTEGGVTKIKERLEFLGWCNGVLKRSRTASEDRALEAEAKLATLEAEKADTLASIAGFEVLPADMTTYTVSHDGATMTVTGSPSGVANVVKLAYGGFEYGMSA